MIFSKAPTRWTVVLLCTVLFCLYLYSAYPAVSPYRDSGDMLSAAYSLGAAHPPGYPLYVLAAHAWLDILPWGDPAYRLHVLSALFGVAAAGLLFLALRRACGSKDAQSFSWPPAVVVFVLLGMAPAFWHLSITSEMYSLNAAFAAALLFLSCRPAPSVDCAAALLFCLGLTNHQTLILAAPGLLWIWRARIAERPAASTAWWSATFGLLGAALVFYLPIRSLANPIIDWGEPRTAEMFWRVLTRADLGSIRLHPERPAGFINFSQWIAGLRITGRMVAGQTGWSGAILAAWGMLAAWRAGTSGRRTAQGACLAFLVSGPFFIGWANLDPAAPETLPILEPHLVLPLVFCCFLAGIGLQDLWNKVRPAWGRILFAGALIVGWIAPLRGAWASLTTYRSDFSAWDYGRVLLDSLKPGAVLVDPDDVTAFSVSYFQTVRRERPDVRPVLFFRTRWGYRQLRRRHPELLPPWEPRSGQELYGAIIQQSLSSGFPVYVDLPQKTPPGTRSVPNGLAYAVAPVSAVETLSRADVIASMNASETLDGLWRVRPASRISDFFTRHTVSYFADASNNLGIETQRLGRSADSMALYARALSLDPEMAEAWNNLGNAHLAQKDLTAAAGDYQAARSVKPAPQVTYNLGRVYLLAGRYDEARREFERAVQEADLPEARNDLGLVYYRTGHPEEAVKLWEELLSRHPDYVTPLYNLGLAYRDLKDYPRARAALTLYRDHAPNPEDRAEADQELRRLPADPLHSRR